MKRFTTLVCLGAAALACAAGSVSATEPLYFLNHNNLGAEGSVITNWDGATAKLTYNNEAPMLGPTVEVINGQKWEKNTFGNYIAGNPPTHSRQDGFNLGGAATAPIAVNGATFVAAIKRGDAITPDYNWRSIVDVMYDRMVLGIKSDTGQLVVRRNGSLDISTGSIAVGQAAVLSLTVQADGSYEVWADGVSMMTRGADAKGMTAWDPGTLRGGDRFVDGHQGDWSKNEDGTWKYFLGWQDNWNNVAFDDFITVGRNQPDSFTVFNGNIGDVKIWTSALSSEERLAQVAGVSQAMGLSNVPEPGTMTALAGLAGMALLGIRRKKA